MEVKVFLLETHFSDEEQCMSDGEQSMSDEEQTCQTYEVPHNLRGSLQLKGGSYIDLVANAARVRITEEWAYQVQKLQR